MESKQEWEKGSVGYKFTNTYMVRGIEKKYHAHKNCFKARSRSIVIRRKHKRDNQKSRPWSRSTNEGGAKIVPEFRGGRHERRSLPGTDFTIALEE